MEKCPCGTGNSYTECCAPYISGEKNAPTAALLMRSRYTAYVTGNIDYIYETTAPEKQKMFDRKSTEEWSNSSEWEKLEIVSTENGTEEDQTGTVEFIAHFKQNNTPIQHHEKSEFIRKDEKWYFKDGKMVNSTFKREQPKTGRNEPCPCGSGKKFKKCCGK